MVDAEIVAGAGGVGRVIVGAADGREHVIRTFLDGDRRFRGERYA